MSENNDLSPLAAVDLVRPSPPRPKFMLGIGAGALLDRTNEQKFTATDTFGSLLKLNAAEVRGRRYCTGFIVTENYVYPIAGRIGTAKVIHDFINLTLFESLSGDKGAPLAKFFVSLCSIACLPLWLDCGLAFIAHSRPQKQAGTESKR